MSGRRGGYGRGKSFNPMDLFGSSRGEALSVPVMQPPPIFPALDCKPMPMELTAEMSYLVELHRDFIEYMQESPNYVQAVKEKEDIERFCEANENSIAEYSKMEHESTYDWDRMPSELRPSQKSKQQDKKKTRVDVNQKFIKLEKKEKLEQRIKAEDESQGEEEEESRQDKEDIKEEEEEDEEMDEDNDYTNEYFDTGENYLSEEENDDDAIYM